MKTFIASGRTVLVDDSCAKFLSDGSQWFCSRRGRTHYVYRKQYLADGRYIREWLHRLITQCPDGMAVDHINGNGLDNRNANLRVCSHAENMKNRRKHKNNTSGFKGVTFEEKSPNPWRARITCDGRKVNIGNFSTPEEAHEAYLREARRLHGEFARAA